MKLLSLCTGYGGLDLAAEAYFGAELIGCADIDKSASIAIEKHFGVPNYGDIRNIVDLDLEFDILTAGYPCQPFSEAGQRKGLTDERHIWPHIAEIIGKFRPGIVVLENVRGHLSLGFREVLADLARLGYDSKWRVVRASDIGAPHHRARVFVVSHPTTSEGSGICRDHRGDMTHAARASVLATPSTNIGHTTGKCRNWGADLLHDVQCTCKPRRMHWLKAN